MDVRQAPELESALLTWSLDDPELAVATAAAPGHRILPTRTVLKIGGQSLMDRGRGGGVPARGGDRRWRKAQHKLLIGTGGRHAGAARVLDGRRAGPAGRCAHAAWRLGRRSERGDAWDAASLATGSRRSMAPASRRCAAILAECRRRCLQRDAALWPVERRRSRGRHPALPHDAGCFLVAEQFGCKAMIFVKDEDGLYTATQEQTSIATLIAKITWRMWPWLQDLS